MRKSIALLMLTISTALTGQIDYSKLIIGRNSGTHTFDNGEQTRIFGFTEALTAPVYIPAPTLDVNSGDSVKLDFWNMSQGAPHTIHLHGMDVDQQNDGVGMLSFEVMHSEHGYYYFKAPHPGTYLYHCHVGSTVHLQAGMYGLVIVRPTDGNKLLNWDGGESYDREFSILASEIDTVWHNDTILDHEHDPLMPMYVPEKFKPQYFLLNGMNGSQLTDPQNYHFALKNEKVYMRLANIGYYGIRYIFPHVLDARTVSSDGRPLPNEVINDTIEVLPGERYETFIQLGTDQFYTVITEHFNLNTQLVESTQSVTIQTSSVETNENEIGSIDIYPNPSDGMFYLPESEIEYSVFSSEGKFILNSKSQHIDLTQKEDGIYFLKIGAKTYPLFKY